MHVFWHVPETENLPMGVDTQSNDFEPGTRYYRNVVEDIGSLSLASNEPDKFKRQGDYVREAIAAGKGHEIPTLTKDMYEQGLLDKGTYLPISHTMKHSSRRGIVAPNNVQISLGTLGDIDAKEFPLRWFGRRLPPRSPKVGDNGPNLERIKNQVRKDAKRAQRS
jgi:hypothetical protein